MRVLCLNYEYPPLGGGSSPVTRSLSRALVARGHEVDVVTMGFEGLPRREADGGVRVFRVASLRRRKELSRVHELASYLPGAWARARRLHRERPYDVCHAHFLLPTGLIPYGLARSGTFPPYLVTSHGSDVPGYNPDRFRLLHRWTPPLLARIGGRAAAVVVPSEAQAELIRRRVPRLAPHLLRIPYGIDTDGLRPGPKERSILVATRLFERKGVHDVLEAVGSGARDGFRLHVAGDGPERDRLQRLAGERGIEVEFHGWLERDAMNAMFRSARIFVLATTIDNFPSSLLEAMAAGCAIVTTRAGGCPEVVGDAAVLVEPGDVGGLRRAIGGLVRDDARCRELGARARARATRMFGWDAIAARHEAAYRTACSTTSEPARGQAAAPARTARTAAGVDTENAGMEVGTG